MRTAPFFRIQLVKLVEHMIDLNVPRVEMHISPMLKQIGCELCDDEVNDDSVRITDMFLHRRQLVTKYHLLCRPCVDNFGYATNVSIQSYVRFLIFTL
jgi:hypothetical protein